MEYTESVLLTSAQNANISSLMVRRNDVNFNQPAYKSHTDVTFLIIIIFLNESNLISQFLGGSSVPGRKACSLSHLHTPPTFVAQLIPYGMLSLSQHYSHRLRTTICYSVLPGGSFLIDLKP